MCRPMRTEHKAANPRDRLDRHRQVDRLNGGFSSIGLKRGSHAPASHFLQSNENFKSYLGGLASIMQPGQRPPRAAVAKTPRRRSLEARPPTNAQLGAFSGWS
jgi:hypothetical protein